ncbi:MAG: hypothetical protein IR153_09895 [Flavobacterium sp.]|nr:hypothetical protein [Flavobacterium sp.]
MSYFLIFLIVILSAAVVALVVAHQRQKSAHRQTVSELQKTIAILDAINTREQAKVQLSNEMKQVLDKARASIDQQLLAIISQQLEP